MSLKDYLDNNDFENINKHLKNVLTDEEVSIYVDAIFNSSPKVSMALWAGLNINSDNLCKVHPLVQNHMVNLIDFNSYSPRGDKPSFFDRALIPIKTLKVGNLYKNKHKDLMTASKQMQSTNIVEIKEKSLVMLLDFEVEDDGDAPYLKWAKVLYESKFGYVHMPVLMEVVKNE